MSGFDHPESSPRVLGAVTVLLTAAAGALNVVTFFTFNGVFASTMSGNLVLTGLSVGRGDWQQAVEEVSAIAGYVVGLALCSVLCGTFMRRRPWRSAVAVALGLELALLVAVGLGWYLLDGRELGLWRGVLLVLGSSLAMGFQACACRYIGPSGTPTNFLTGTVTNMVSALFDPNKPKWDGNSLLRILAMAAGAVAAALLQTRASGVVVLLPVGLVVVALLLMGFVLRTNHGGLTVGEAEAVRVDGRRMLRQDVPDAVGTAEPDADPTGEQSLPTAGHGHLYGRVLDADDGPHAAVLTLVDLDGQQVARATADADGHYRLVPGARGEFLLVCLPDGVADRREGLRPQAVMVAVDGRPVAYDVVVGRDAVGAAGEPLEAV